MKRFLPVILACGVLPALPVRAADKVDFNYDIRPLISSKCFHCHGPDEKSRKAKLRLDLRDDAVKEHESGKTIVPGDPGTSELINRITSKDADEVMPPPKEEHALTPHEVDLLRRWIAEGAEYKPHWSFVKPTRPSVPAIADPQAIVKNPIDAFIQTRLAGTGLKPSPEADRHTLIRRASLDLIGLPPTPEETEAFVHDESPNAYEKLVDRLLASPSFGERWAKMWLDLARYADSTGYGSDFFRLNIWPYRDWVINAFNRNEPYDQFSIDQIGGDLLPNPTREQLVATAFHRNTMTNVEGGTVAEEYRVAAVKDRIATTGQVWMGLTVGCAQCHSHKFDPIPQKDYYSLFAIFNQTQDNNRKDEEPTMPLPTPEQESQMAQIKAEIAALESSMKTSTTELLAEQKTWEAQMAQTAQWQTLAAGEIKAESGTTLAAQADGSYLAVGTDRPATDVYTLKVQPMLDGKITAFRLEVLPDDSLPAHGPGRADNGNAVLSELRVTAAPPGAHVPQARYVRVTLPGSQAGLALAEVQVFSDGENIAPRGTASQSSTDFGGDAKRAIDGNTDGNFSKGKSVSHTGKDAEPWWEVDLGAEAEIENVVIWNRTDGVGERLKNFYVGLLDGEHQPAFDQVVVEAPKPSATVNPSGTKTVTLKNASADFSQSGWTADLAIDGDRKNGWAFAPEFGQPHAAVFETTTPLDTHDSELTFTLRQSYGQRHTLGRFRLSATTQSPAPRELPPQIKTILAVAPDARTPQQSTELTNYFRPLSKAFAQLGQQLETKRKALAAIKPLDLPVMRELAENKRRETHLLNKGNYLAPAEKVEPGLLSNFSSFVPADSKMDRLAVGRWLVSPENPLTARVAVNRFWSQLFGTGLVETEEDFGSQGALPSHPELLDWLAVNFMSPKSDDAAQPALGWDMKALLRLIVTSGTYRHSSKVTPDMLEKDARNRLLARAPRRRLDAEAVRDQALALSGLLSHKMGGPSVYPPQPDGLWKVAFNGGQNAYPTSKGEDRYRRGLYTFWRRTMPYPSMATFDAPSRESCTMRRLPTNTPLQAFVTMNDPAFVECAQALGRRIVREGGTSVGERVQYGLRLCLGHPASDAQVQALSDLYNGQLADYQANAADALKLATMPLGPLPEKSDAAEMAAWTVVANVLLNLDAVLTKN